MDNQLVTIAHEIKDYQTAQGLSTAAMIRQYPDLGSDKTYNKILRGDIGDLDVEQQLINYTAVSMIIADIDATVEETPIIEGLSAVVLIRKAILNAMRATGTNRVVIVQGNSGMGKSTAIEIIAKRYGSRVLPIEASEIWNDSPNHLLGAILSKLGIHNQPQSAVAKMERVKQELNASRRCLIVDEAHHLGKKCLNTVKTLINSTKGEVVLVAIPTLWARLETDAYQEARQISTNRLSERVQLGLTKQDIATYLEAATSLSADLRRKATAQIADLAFRLGNFAFVRDCALAINQAATQGEMDIKAVIAAITHTSAKR